MLFNLFGKKKEEAAITFMDRTYMHETAKFNAMVALAKENEIAVFITWFPETLRKLKDAFRANGVDEQRVKEHRTVTELSLNDKVPVFAEHHPLRAKELALTNGWPEKKVIVFNSLDEPFFSLFGGDKIISMMQKLGMKEEEMVQHAMISKSIINAQKKVEKKVTIEQAAQSQAEWIERNAK